MNNRNPQAPAATRFIDRADAGRQLARLLASHAAQQDTLVLGLARGGVPVAYEVARALRLPLDVMVVRKLGAPHEPEFAMGAIAPGGVIVVNEDMPRWLFQSSALEQSAAAQLAELQRRQSLYQAGRTPLLVAGRVVILVDDGAATGSSVLAAVRALRKQGAREIIVALPVASSQALEKLHQAVDQLICAHTPEAFDAVGSWYRDFDQTTDQQVCKLLERATARRRGKSGPQEPP